MSRMLYKHPGTYPMHGDFFDYIVIEESELTEHLDAGWSLTTDEAKNYDILEADIIDDAAPTRAEIEAKAEELNLNFNKRISNKNLLKKIDEALR